MSTLIWILLLASNLVFLEEVIEYKIWETISLFLISLIYIFFLYINSFVSTLQKHDSQNKKLMLGLSLSVTNAHNSWRIPTTLNQNLIKLFSLAEFLFTTHIPRWWFDSSFVRWILRLNILTNLRLIITKFNSWFALIWEFNKMQLIFSLFLQMVIFIQDDFPLDYKISIISCLDVWNNA